MDEARAGGLSGDTEVGPGSSRPTLAGGGPAPARPMPTDAPGSNVGGWMKCSAPEDGGWDRIDDIPGNSDAGWQQT